MGVLDFGCSCVGFVVPMSSSLSLSGSIKPSMKPIGLLLCFFLSRFPSGELLDLRFSLDFWGVLLPFVTLATPFLDREYRAVSLLGAELAFDSYAEAVTAMALPT